jgi:hypothetical protein
MMRDGVALGLLDLPVEILLGILVYLDAYKLARARGARKKKSMPKGDHHYWHYLYGCHTA